MLKYWMITLTLLLVLCLVESEGKSERSPYDVMKVPRDADEVQIKKAFRKLARMYHPDNADTGDEEKYMELVDANEILSDPDKRAHYDRFGHASSGAPGGGGGFPGGFPGGFGARGGENVHMKMDVNMGDLFKMFSQTFGGGAGAGSFGERMGSQFGSQFRNSFASEFGGANRNAHTAQQKKASRNCQYQRSCANGICTSTKVCE